MMKNKIMMGLGIILCLVIAWHLGTNPSQTVVYTPGQVEQQADSSPVASGEAKLPAKLPLESKNAKKETAQASKVDSQKGDAVLQTVDGNPKDEATQTVEPTTSDSQTSENGKQQQSQKAEEPKTKIPEGEVPKAEETKSEPKKEGAETKPATPPASTVVEVSDQELDDAQSDKKKADALKQEIIDNQDVSKKDKYMTDPVPEGKPKPVEPQDISVDKETSFKVKLSVSCGTILNNMNLLDKNKYELVPEDGIIFPLQEVTAYKGESVFNVLLREMQNNKIHMEFVNTPMYNSAYIEGINNLYEFDTGELSGWMYKVNEWFPNYGCSRYEVKEGDVIEWVYTCDLGRDVGDSYYDK